MSDFVEWREKVRRDYRPELVDFYASFFNDRKETEEFIDGIHDLVAHNPVPMRVMHTIQRLGSLSRDIDEIRPGEPLMQLFFLMVAIEAVHAIAFPDNGDSKVEIIVDFFTSYINSSDQERLLQGIRRSAIDSRSREGEELSMEVVARIFNETRNTMVHEGDFWGANGFNFPPEGGQREVLLEVKEGKKDLKGNRVYRMDIAIDEVRPIVLRGLTSFLHSVSSIYLVSG